MTAAAMRFSPVSVQEMSSIDTTQTTTNPTYAMTYKIMPTLLEDENLALPSGETDLLVPPAMLKNKSDANQQLEDAEVLDAKVAASVHVVDSIDTECVSRFLRPHGCENQEVRLTIWRAAQCG
jgi:hypothetical protein